MASTQAIPTAAATAPLVGAGRLTDSHGRAITDLRVSVTDRCNYRCIYCRTGNDGAQYSELPLADYLRIIRVFVSLGIEKVRLTGGEPLLRRDLTTLVREVAAAAYQLRVRRHTARRGSRQTAGSGRYNERSPARRAGTGAAARQA